MSSKYLNKFYRPSNDLRSTLNELSDDVQQEDFDRAIANANHALSLAKKEFGDQHPVYANILRKIGYIYVRTGHYTEAKSMFELSIMIFADKLGDQHAIIGTLYKDIGFADYHNGDEKSAWNYLQKSLSIYVKELGPDHEFSTVLKSDIEHIEGRAEAKSEGETLAKQQYSDAIACVKNAQYDQAEDLLLASLAYNTKSYGQEHPNVAACYTVLSDIMDKRGDLERAIAYLQKTTEIEKLFLETRSDNYIVNLLRLAMLFLKKGNAPQSEKLLVEVGEMSERYGFDSPLAVDGYLKFSHAQRERGQYVKAIEYALKAQKMKTVNGSVNRQTALVYSQLGTLYNETQQYVLAEKNYLEALSIKKQIFGSEHLEYAFTLFNLGVMYIGTNELEKAYQNCKQAKKIAETQLDEFHPWMMAINDQIGRIAERDDYSLDKVSADLNKLKQKYGECSTTYLEQLSVAANTSFSIEAYEDACSYCDDLLSVFENKGLFPTHTFFKTLHLRAKLYVQQENFQKAFMLYKMSLQLQDQHDLKVGEHRLTALRELIGIDQIINVNGNSEDLFAELFLYEDRYIHGLISATGEEQRADLVDMIKGSFDLLMTDLHLGKIGDLKFCYETLLRRKGIFIEISLKSFDKKDLDNNPELKPKVKELQCINKQLSDMVIEPYVARGIDHFYKNYNDLNIRKSIIEKEITRTLPFSNLDILNRNNHIDQIFKYLSDDKIIIDYIKFSGNDSQAHYGCFVLNASNEQPIIFKYLAQSSEIEDLISAYVEIVSVNPMQKDKFTADLMQKKLSGKIVDLLFPTLDLISKQQEISIVPAGLIWTLPLDSLFFGNQSRLVDEFTISHLASTRDILQFSSGSILDLSRSLVISSPDFNLSDKMSFEQRQAEKMSDDLKFFEDNNIPPPATWGVKFSISEENFEDDKSFFYDTSGVEFRITYFEPLDGSLEEGKVIAGLLNCGHFFGKDVTREWIYGIESPPILHISTHGFFCDKRQWSEIENQRKFFAKQSSSDVLISGFFDIENLLGDITGYDDFEKYFERKAYKFNADNLLNYSGLVLSGINTWLKSGFTKTEASFGFINAEHIANMNFHDTELVVLSCCETGLGKIDDHEGVIGLRRAFGIAGCQSMVTTLWKISDEKTVEFMQLFYSFLLSGLPKNESLRKTKLIFKEKNPDPYYWGGFVLEGNVRPITVQGH